MQVLPEHKAGEADKVDDDAEVNAPSSDDPEADTAAAGDSSGSDLREPLLGGGEDIERVRASLVFRDVCSAEG